MKIPIQFFAEVAQDIAIARNCFPAGAGRKSVSARHAFTACTVNYSLLKATPKSQKKSVSKNNYLSSPTCSSVDQFQNTHTTGELLPVSVEGLGASTNSGAAGFGHKMQVAKRKPSRSIQSKT